MPLASPPISSTSVATSSTAIYTAATTYVRDLVVTNAGPNTFSLGTGTVTIAGGLALPAGQQLVIQGPVESLNAIVSSGSFATAIVGYGSVVSVI